MHKTQVTQTKSTCNWLGALAGCAIPLAMIAGCNGSGDGGPTPLPTATSVPSATPVATATATGAACSTGTGSAAFVTRLVGSFNPRPIANGCATGRALLRGSLVSAATLELEDTQAGEKRTLICLLSDPNGLQVNKRYQADASTYNETLLSDSTIKQWKAQNLVVVIDSITTTSIRYHFQGSFTPGSLSQASVAPGTGTFALSGSASSSLAE